jgi:CRP/FNR family cyclic AMP-dependent transcriptional regulator
VEHAAICVAVLGVSAIRILIPVLLALLVLAAAWIGIRWAGSEQVDLVRAVPLFQGLSERQLRSVLGSARRMEFDPGKRIVEQGSPGRSFFAIREGTASVSVRGQELAKLGPGSYFGEVALLDEGPRTAAVTAVTRTVTVEVPSSGFARLLDADPGVARAIEMRLRELLAASGESLPPRVEGLVDRSALASLGRRLRAVQEVDWAEGKAPARRWPWART